MLEDCGDISYRAVAGRRIAFQTIAGRGPGLFFLPGYASDMSGAKAEFLADLAQQEGIGFTRMDYSGHGKSSGTLAEGDLALWLEDALAVFDATDGPQIVVGSSMGGWLALHIALARPVRVAALVGIAAAPDFTEDLMWARFSDAQKRALTEDGFIEIPSTYGPPQIITQRLIASGRSLLLLGAPIAIDCPVRLLHGLRDRDVPYETSLKLVEALTSNDMRLHLIKDGEHRLSREDDLSLLRDVVLELTDHRRTENTAISWSRL